MSILNCKFLFVAKNFNEGRPVAYSNGCQRVLVMMKYQDTFYVVIEDKNTNSIYINRLKSVIVPELYVSENFDKIKDAEEWDAVYNNLKAAGIML